MDLDAAILTRRTTKNFTDEVIPEGVVRELLELAQWAPNHKLTIPWRFRLLGPETTERLIALAPADKKNKVVRAPTRIVVSCRISGDPARREEDLHATAAAVQNLLLAATARGIDSFWQSPTPIGSPAARIALGLEPDEQLVGTIHLGRATGERAEPARPALDLTLTVLP